MSSPQWPSMHSTSTLWGASWRKHSRNEYPSLDREGRGEIKACPASRLSARAINGLFLCCCCFFFSFVLFFTFTNLLFNLFNRESHHRTFLTFKTEGFNFSSSPRERQKKKLSLLGNVNNNLAFLFYLCIFLNI